jgi:uncharacterized protein (DUF2147 family)
MRLLILLALFSTSALAAAPAKTAGDWYTPVGSVIRIAACGGAVCATIVKVPSNAPETTDKLNPSASQRSRPICGLAIGTGFHQDDPEHLSGGRLYDPTTGHTYKGTLTAEGDTLHLRGYVGISLFGRSQVWHRVATVAACK